MNDRSQARTIYILWVAFFASNGIYTLLAYFITQTRLTHPEQATSLHDPLTGSLLCLPVALPIFLLPLGLLIGHKAQNGAFDNAVAGERTAVEAARRENSSPLGRTKTALILTMAVYEANTLIGLLLFFIGTPLVKFLAFPIGTACLLLIALQRLIATLAR